MEREQLMTQTKSQQFQDAGFDKKQADAIAASYDNLSNKVDETGWHIAQLIQSQSETDSKVAEHMGRMADFQSETNRRFDETDRKLAEHMGRMADFQSDTSRRFDETDRKLAELMGRMDDFQSETNHKFDETDRKLSELMARMTDFQAETNRRFDEADRKFEEINGRLSRLENQMSQMVQALLTMSQKIDAAIYSLNQRIDGTNDRIDAAIYSINQRIDDTNKRIDDLIDKVDKLSAVTAKMFWVLAVIAVYVAVVAQDGIVPSIMSMLLSMRG